MVRKAKDKDNSNCFSWGHTGIYWYGHTGMSIEDQAGQQSVVLITGPLTVLTKPIRTLKMNTITIALILLSLWVGNYGNQFKLLTNNGAHLLSKFFVPACCTLGVNTTSFTEYHQQTNSWRNVSTLLWSRDHTNIYLNIGGTDIHRCHR